MTSDIFIRLSTLVFGLFIIGSALCLPIYHWDLRRFLQSQLWIKTVLWLPIYVIFVIIAYGGLFTASLVTLIVISFALYEFTQNKAWHRGGTVPKLYLSFFIIASTAIILLALQTKHETYVNLLITICFSSVLSDTCAFFFGSYASWHKLPRWINNHKSWEGIVGQIVGAFIGAGCVTLVMPLPVPWWFILAIGVSSATGDLFNSITKRKLAIKDWGNTIPGHGGVADRMSSLSTTFLVVVLLLQL